MENTLVNILNSEIKFDDKYINKPMVLNELDYEFFHIQEITYEEDAPRREALENVLGSLRISGVNFAYLITGSKEKISFYFGVAKNRKNLDVDIDDIAKQILKSNIEGNFRGTKVVRLTKDEKITLRKKVKDFSNIAELNGVPNLNEEAEKFQGIDRLVDIMLKDEFALMILSSAMPLNAIEDMEKELFNIYDKITPHVKKTIQKTVSKAKNENEVHLNLLQKATRHQFQNQKQKLLVHQLQHLHKILQIVVAHLQVHQIVQVNQRVNQTKQQAQMLIVIA